MTSTTPADTRDMLVAHGVLPGDTARPAVVASLAPRACARYARRLHRTATP